MYLEQRFNFFNPPQFNPNTAAALLGTTQRWSIDRTWPIEEIIIFINFQLTTGLTIFNTPTTPDLYDNMLQLLQHVNLSVNDGRQPRSVVDCSGVALLEYASQAGFNIDQATLTAINAAQSRIASTTFPVGRYQMVYRIPCAPPQLGEPLRSRTYLPVHTYPQDPVLTLSFNSIANMGASAVFSDPIRVDVMLIRRVPTAASEALLRKTAGSNPTGYIDWDMIETPFNATLGASKEERFAIPVPGNYLDLLFRQYKGGSSYDRTVPIDVDVGDSITNNLGLETRWRLETGLVVLREWRWKHLRTINDFIRPQQVAAPLLTVAPTVVLPNGGSFVAIASAGSSTIGVSNQPTNFPSALQAAAANYRAGTSAYIDFLGDNLSMDTPVELGGLLDCNTPANNGLKMEIIGTCANVATNPSFLYVMGRRLFGDISRWQKF